MGGFCYFRCDIIKEVKDIFINNFIIFMKNCNKSFKSGFTLLELLVVVAIIGILAAVAMAALNNANNKGRDAAVKSNLKNAVTQGEILFNTRTANTNTYTNACTNGIVDGAKGVGELVLAATKAVGLSSYDINAMGSSTTATCNNSANGWAAQVPLKITTPAANQMWCVDSTGKAVQTTGSTLTAVGDVACN